MADWPVTNFKIGIDLFMRRRHIIGRFQGSRRWKRDTGGHGGARGPSHCYFIDIVCEPVEALNKTITTGSTGAKDADAPVGESIQLESVSDLFASHRVRKILLVCIHQDRCFWQLPSREYSMKFCACLMYSIGILTVDDKDKSTCPCVVMPPEGAYFILATHVLKS